MSSYYARCERPDSGGFIIVPIPREELIPGYLTRPDSEHLIPTLIKVEMPCGLIWVFKRSRRIEWEYTEAGAHLDYKYKMTELFCPLNGLGFFFERPT